LIGALSASLLCGGSQRVIGWLPYGAPVPNLVQHNPLEWLNKEIRRYTRYTDVLGIFPRHAGRLPVRPRALRAYRGIVTQVGEAEASRLLGQTSGRLDSIKDDRQSKETPYLNAKVLSVCNRTATEIRLQRLAEKISEDITGRRPDTKGHVIVNNDTV
jgi:hypothetical protein